MQTETALYTMESETFFLDHCCIELFPIVNITPSLVKAVGLPVGVSSMKLSVHENNSGALILARTLPPKFTPRTKYYATKMIFFREEINKRKILLLKSQQFSTWDTSSLRVYLEQPLNTYGIKSWVGNFRPSLRT